jgi:hypothetical protein
MLLSGSSTTRRGKLNSGSSNSAADRVQAERTQVYERLSLSSHIRAERLHIIFARFSIPLKEKKKKAALTESLCESFWFPSFRWPL